MYKNGLAEAQFEILHCDKLTITKDYANYHSILKRLIIHNPNPNTVSGNQRHLSLPGSPTILVSLALMRAFNTGSAVQRHLSIYCFSQCFCLTRVINNCQSSCMHCAQ